MCREGVTPYEDDHNLSPHNDDLNGNEEIVTLYTFKYVHLVVNASVVVLVEDLHPHEGIEN